MSLACAFELLLCARLCAKQFACCILQLHVGDKVTEGSSRQGLFAEAWAASKEAAGLAKHTGLT